VGHEPFFEFYKVASNPHYTYLMTAPLGAFFQGRAGVLKRTANEQRLMGPRHGWIKIGVGGITDQT
jgi:hypothetical protein